MIHKFFRSPCFPALTALALALGMVWLTEFPDRDVLHRYAPMAEAVAAGDWKYAFHPRVPFLFPLLGGFFTLFTGGDGFTGCKIAGAVCFALTVFPLWGIFRKVFDQKTALWGTMLFALCSSWLKVTASGNRESTKMLFFMIGIYALVSLWEERRRLKYYLLMGASAAAMSLVRDDALLVGGMMGLAALFFELCGLRRFPWRTLLAALLGLIVLLPGLATTYAVTGYPALSVRFLDISKAIFPEDAFGRVPGMLPRSWERPAPEKNAGDAAGTEAGTIDAGGNVPEMVQWLEPPREILPEHITEPPFSWKRIADFIEAILRGSCFFFAIPALVMLAVRCRKKRCSPPEAILAGAFAGHTLAIVFQVLIADGYLYISRRYMLPAAPLLFGWTALMIFDIREWIAARFPGRAGERLWRGMVTAAVIMLAANAADGQLDKRFGEKERFKRETIKKWSEAIRAGYNGPPARTPAKLWLECYMSYRRPVVVCYEMPELGYLAGGESFSTTLKDGIRRGLDPDFALLALPPGRTPKIPDNYMIWKTAGNSKGRLLLLAKKGVLK